MLNVFINCLYKLANLASHESCDKVLALSFGRKKLKLASKW